MGRTITTDTQTGNLIVAFLAVLASIGMNSLWNLILFTYYQLRLKTKYRDGLAMQQQALLRTLPTSSTLTSECLRLWWAWRTRTRKASMRSLVQNVLGSAFTIVISVVGIFSSYLVDGTNIEVLVSSPSCRPLDTTKFLKGSVGNGADYSGYVMDLGYACAKDCYETPPLPDHCKTFIRPTVKFNQTRVECPFDPSLCKNISLPGIMLDSGLVNIGQFGTNLQPKDNVKYRKRTTCAVFELKNHQTSTKASDYPDYQKWLGPMQYPEEESILVNLGTRYGGTGMNETDAVGVLKQKFALDYRVVYAVDAHVFEQITNCTCRSFSH